MHRRTAWLVIAIVTMTLAVPAAAHAAPAGDVKQQRTHRALPVATYPEAGGHVYIAETGGITESTVEIQLEAQSPDELVLHPADDGLLQDQSALVACPATAADDVISADCSQRSQLRRATDGTWHLNLAGLVDGTPGGGWIVIAPDPASVASTWRVALDASKTSIQAGDGGIATQPDAFDGGNPGSDPAAYAPPTDAPRVEGTAPVGDGLVADPAPPAEAPRTPVAVAGLGQVGRSTVGQSLLVESGVLLAAGAFLLGRRRRRPGTAAAPLPRAGRNPLLVAALVLAGMSPMLGQELTSFKAGVVLIAFVAVIGLHVLVNGTGQLSLAHSAMVGLPAFVTLRVCERFAWSPLYLLPLATVIGGLVGAIVALPTLRAKDVQVALVTLVAGIAIARFFYNQTWLVPASGGAGAPTPTLGPIALRTSRSLYPVLFACVVTAALSAWALAHSKLGRAWAWVRDDPTAAAAFGIPVTRCKISAFAVGGAYAGLAGGLTVMWVQRLGSDAFPSSLSFTYLMIAVVAGRGALGGVGLATLVLLGGQQFGAYLFGRDVGHVLDTVIAYGGPLALIDMLARHERGLNGIGRKLMERTEQDSTGRASRVLALAPGGVAGWTAIASGFTAIGLAWEHISRTDQIWVQNQEILSGGIGGLAAVLLGIGLLIRERIGVAATPSVPRSSPPPAPGEREHEHEHEHDRSATRATEAIIGAEA